MTNRTHTDNPATQHHLSTRAQVIALQAEVSRLEQELEEWRLRVVYQHIEIQAILDVIQAAMDDIDLYPLHSIRGLLLPLLKARLEQVLQG